MYLRGLFEGGSELEQHKLPNLAILTTHLLCYPQVVKYFVAKDNPRLAQRLHYGLTLLKQSGEFDRFFAAFPHHKKVLEQLDLSDAQVFWLPNPDLPDSVDPSGLKQDQLQLLRLLARR